jgi:hypothetical protein
MLRRPVKVGRCARRFKQLRGTCTRWRGEVLFDTTADRRVIESHDSRLGAELHPGHAGGNDVRCPESLSLLSGTHGVSFSLQYANNNTACCPHQHQGTWKVQVALASSSSSRI